MNFSNFKKVSEDDKAATLTHPDGHQIRIAKEKLSKKLQNQLSGLPMYMSGGGEAENPGDLAFENKNQMEIAPRTTEEENIVKEASQTPASAQNVYETTKSSLMNEDRVGDPSSGMVIGRNNAGFEQAVENNAIRAAQDYQEQQRSQTKQKIGQAVSQEQQREKDVQKYTKLGLSPPGDLSQPSQQLASARSPQGQPSGPTNFELGGGDASQSGLLSSMAPDMQGYQQAFAGQEAGIAGEAQALGKQGQMEAKAANQEIGTAQKLQNQFTQASQNIQTKRQAIIDDMMNNHFDPNHYIKNMSGGQKAITAIGLILGGAGAGLTGQPNLAMQFLNSQIDRDIDSQKAELGKKNNLLSAYQQEFGNAKDAEDMARITSATVYQAQLKKAAGMAASPLAQSRALQAISQLEHQVILPTMQNMAGRSALMQGAGRAGGIDPAILSRFIQDPKDKEAIQKEISKADEVNKLRDALEGSAKHLEQMGLSGVLKPGDVESATNSFAASIEKASAGRYNEDAAKNEMRAFLYRPGDSQKTTQNKAVRRRQFFDSMISDAVSRGYGINLRGGGLPGGSSASRPMSNVPVSYNPGKR